MQLSPIPSSVTSIEGLTLWALLALDSKQYPAHQLSSGRDPSAPVSFAVARVSTGDNYGKRYARVSADIELTADSSFLPLYESVAEFLYSDILSVIESN